MNIGENIKKYRKLKKLTQPKLGILLEKSESTIRKYESGDVIPSLDVLEKIAELLDVELNAFIGVENLIPEEVVKASSDYYLEQYLFTLGYQIIADEENGYLILRTASGEYEIMENDINNLKTSSKSFIEFKLHEIMNKSRKIGK